MVMDAPEAAAVTVRLGEVFLESVFSPCTVTELLLLEETFSVPRSASRVRPVSLPVTVTTSQVLPRFSETMVISCWEAEEQEVVILPSPMTTLFSPSAETLARMRSETKLTSELPPFRLMVTSPRLFS